MRVRRITVLWAALAASICVAAVSPTTAKEIEVKMLNRGEKGIMVFEPDFVNAMPGDVIKFVPTDKSHNVESIPGMLPEGVAAFKSKVNETFELKVEAPGLYGIKCTPHVTMGMIALIEVGGDLRNLDQLEEVKLPVQARQRMKKILESLAK